jgi:hypothetical protein
MMENKVFEAINKITAELAKSGISKDRKNAQQGYAFRGIDDIYNTLATLLAANKLCILPEVLDSKQVERTNKNGGAIFYTTVKVKYTLVSSEDGSKFECVTYGEAMDSADKSTNKAMSAAYKYLCLQVFCIPTEGDNDADATTHEVSPQPKKLTLDERMAAAANILNNKTADDYASDTKLQTSCANLIADLKAAGRDDDAMTIEIAVAALGGK